MQSLVSKNPYAIITEISHMLDDKGDFALSHRTIQKILNATDCHGANFKAELDGMHLCLSKEKSKKSVIRVPIFVIMKEFSAWGDDEGHGALKIRFDKIDDSEYLFKMWQKCATMGSRLWKEHVRIGLELGCYKITNRNGSNFEETTNEFLFSMNGVWKTCKHSFHRIDIHQAKETTHSDYVRWSDPNNINPRVPHKLTHLLVQEEKLNDLVRFSFFETGSNVFHGSGGQFLTFLTSVLEKKLITGKGHTDSMLCFHFNGCTWIWQATNIQDYKGQKKYKILVRGDKLTYLES